MTLSVEMIAESMQPFGARVVMQQERTFAFRRVQMLTPESENTLEEDVLYVSEPKVIRRLPKGLLHDHFFSLSGRARRMRSPFAPVSMRCCMTNSILSAR